jgi:hypothetical protein
MQFHAVLQTRKHSNWLISLHTAIRDCHDCFPTDWTESALLPRLYACLRTKPAGLDPLV